MSDSEIDRYLAILSGLLRLDPRRRDEIATELRDHLEERLDELLARGYSKPRAILMALEEFGDAAGLAGEFLQIFRKQRQRWYMKLTIGSAATGVAICFALFALWPGHSAAPVLSQVMAQEKQAEPNDQGPVERPLTIQENNAQAEGKLGERLPAVYEDVPVLEVLAHIQAQYGVSIFMDRKHIQSELGLDLSDPQYNVSVELPRVRGDMLLDIVLKDLELVYTIRDGIVFITDELESMSEVRVYNCSDLLAAGSPGKEGAGMGEYGAERGGFGSELGFGGESGFGGGDEGGPGYGAAAGAGLDAGYEPPAAAKPATSAYGGSGEEPPAKRRRAGAAMGSDMAPGMMGSGGMMPGGMSGYGGGMMGGMAGSGGMGMPGSGFGLGAMAGQGGMGDGKGASRVRDLDALIEVIISTVMPDSWQEVGGPGSIEPYYGGLLIVNNNPKVHQRIESLLKMIREARRQQSGAVVREQ